MEDMNYLLHCEQTELLAASNAASCTAKLAHMDLARGYAERISSHRLPYRTPSAAGKVGFDAGVFGANPRKTLSVFKKMTT